MSKFNTVLIKLTPGVDVALAIWFAKRAAHSLSDGAYGWMILQLMLVAFLVWSAYGDLADVEVKADEAAP